MKKDNERKKDSRMQTGFQEAAAVGAGNFTGRQL